MNKIALLLFLLLPFKSIAEIPAKEMPMGQALVDYGKIAGAWHLNNQCSFLTDPEVKRFEDNVASITVALTQDLGTPRMLFVIQKSSKKVAESKKYGVNGKNGCFLAPSFNAFPNNPRSI